MKPGIKISVLFILVSYLIFCDNEKLGYRLKLVKFNLKGSKNIANVTYEVHNWGGNGSQPDISYSIQILKAVNEFHIRISMQISSQICNLCHSIFNNTINLCRFIKNSKRSGLFSIMLNSVDNEKILLSRCPMNKVGK